MDVSEERKGSFLFLIPNWSQRKNIYFSRLQDLFRTDADIIPKYEEGILLIRIHSASRPVANRALASLFDELNSYEMIYPGTKMTTVHELIGVP